MSGILIAVDDPHGSPLAAELEREGFDTRRVAAGEPALAAEAAMFGDRDAPAIAADILVLAVSRTTLTPTLLAACDREGVRIVALADDADGRARAMDAGLGEPLPLDAGGWRVADAFAAPTPAPVPQQRRETGRGAVVAVWGPAGAPGRSTIAIALAAELARDGRRVGLVDADVHAPSIALALGLADEGPGFAAACRQTERGGLDAAELSRISSPLHGDAAIVEVLSGINRPSRWPELTHARVTAALEACRDWVDCTVVDVSASLEQDEEIVSDLDGPRRNAATLAALRAADLVVAVLAADPLGASRFVRCWPELRATVGTTPVLVVANRLRPGALGVDPRGQVRRTLDRFAGISDVTFLPLDPRAADAAMLSARPIMEVAPRSPFTVAVRRFVGQVLVPAVAPSESMTAVLPMVARPTRRAPRRERRTA